MRDETTGDGAGAGRERIDLRAEVVRALSRATDQESELDVDRDGSGAAGGDGADAAAAEARLRRAVAGYTRAMRRSGLRPERVLVHVKQILREAGAGIEPPRRRALTERATLWCIAAYFEDADSPSARTDAPEHGG